MSVNTSNLRMKRLAAGLSAAIALIGVQAHAFASVIPVTSCADDETPGTLRQTIARAMSGDQIDLSGLQCAYGEIALTQGELVIAQNVVLSGGLGNTLTIISDNGRVLHSTAADFSVVNLTVSGSGGGIYTKSDNAEGGCILADGNVSLIGSTVSDCAVGSANASARGGAISAQSVSLVSSRITGSSANSNGSNQIAQGGGIYAKSLSCVDSTLSGNSVAAEPNAQGGGALIADGDVNLLRCTIDTNTAGEGAGLMQIVHQGSSATTQIVNSTISGNTATFSAGGVEVFCIKCTPQPVQLLNSTLAFNSSPTSYGDGVMSNGGVNAQSSIIANNGAEDGSPFGDLFATELTGASNLVMGTNLKPASGVVTVKDDPLLMPLANNGGPTRTHNMQASSPVIQTGNNFSLLATDQRGNGFSRTNNGLVDIGAFQHCQPTTTPRKLPPIKKH